MLVWHSEGAASINEAETLSAKIECFLGVAGEAECQIPAAGFCGVNRYVLSIAPSFDLHL